MVADWVVHPVESDKCDAQSDGGEQLSGGAGWAKTARACARAQSGGEEGEAMWLPGKKFCWKNWGFFLMELHDKNWGWYSVRAREIRLPAAWSAPGHGMHSSFIEAAHLCFIIWILLMKLSKQRHF